MDMRVRDGYLLFSSILGTTILHCTLLSRCHLSIFSLCYWYCNCDYGVVVHGIDFCMFLRSAAVCDYSLECTI